MENRRAKIDRRNFLKSIGAAGVGSAIGAAGLRAEPNKPCVEADKDSKKKEKDQMPQVPKRVLGKTGIEVPCLSLGTAFNTIDKQIVLRKALDWGVTYWDTAVSYMDGNSEIGIGKFIEKNPEARKKLFIATKFSKKNVADFGKSLKISLDRMKIDYIDLFFYHGLSDPAKLTNELRQQVENAKKQKLIRFFGFSTHTNPAKCLIGAAKLDWIDVVMSKYNFRLMQDPKIQAGIDACYKAGIGLIAMKVQAKGQIKMKNEEDKKLADKFLESGYTQGQVKLKIVLEDKRISSACVGRDNIGHLMLNVAATLDRTKLTMAEKEFLNQYAQDTCSGYCAGCSNICETALGDMPYVSEIMRYLMYYNSYGEKAEARRLFAQIPTEVQKRLLNIDYSLAETRCPQHIPIGKFIAEAVNKLT